MMRVLQLANFYHPHSGGLRTAIDALARGYASRGHEAVLVVPGDRHERTEVGGRAAIVVRAPRLPRSGGYRLILDRHAIAEIVAAMRPDVIELSDRTTLARIVAGLDHRPPTLLYSHERLDQLASVHSKLSLGVSRLADRWTRKLVRSVDAVACASQFAADELVRVGARVVHRVPLGVDLETFHPAARSRVEECRSAARAVVVGRLAVEKDPEHAIVAIDRLIRCGRDVELLVVGDGPQRQELERIAPPGTRFLGHIGDRHEVAGILASADVAICPGPNETFGLAALEAMATGTPVACVGSGALPELVSDRTGAIARPGANGLAAAIDRVLDGDRREQRRAARAHAERYSWSRSVDSMLSAFDSVLDPRSSLLAG